MTFLHYSGDRTCENCASCKFTVEFSELAEAKIDENGYLVAIDDNYRERYEITCTDCGLEIRKSKLVIGDIESEL